MAAGKSKAFWPILILIAVAVVFIVLSFTKEKPASSPTMDVLADNPAATSTQTTAPSIKPTHTTADQAAIPKHAEAVVMPPQPIAPKTTLAVQVYSFKEKARADASLQKLKDKGFSNSYIMVSDVGARGTWYRVRVGTFANEEEAMKTLEAVTREFKSGIIVTE
jgi:DedD protein